MAENQEEWFAIVDKNLNQIGTATRSQAHREGLFHQVVHCWVLENDRIWFQQRSFSKKDFPGYYEIAATGHMDLGESPREALLRETREEIGIKAEHPIYLGRKDETTHVGDFFDREAAHVFLVQILGPRFSPGPEVERMVWAYVQDYIGWMEGRTPILTVYGPDGRADITYPKDWCSHEDEFLRMVLPAIGGKESFNGAK